MSDSTPVLEARDLSVHFSQSKSITEMMMTPFRDEEMVRAVDGVSLELAENEVTAVIGESGCGKTTLVKTLMGLQDPTGGEILYQGRALSSFDRSDWKDFRSNVQIVFQDPFNSLDPKMTVEETLREPLYIHGFEDRDRRVRETLETVELSPPEKFLDQLPRQLSGGEKQRVAIARALILEPDILLADEPVSMLDVSTQVSILRVFKRLAAETDVAVAYISHDISTVSYVCEEINVMYLGKIVEQAPTQELIDDPEHPYTRELLRAIPIPDPDHERTRSSIPGNPPDPVDLPTGCNFKDRCPDRMEICDKDPVLYPTDETHRTKCHLHYDHEAYEESGREATADPAGQETAADGGAE